jgi:flagella basal body P-ring formation protein FlgA
MLVGGVSALAADQDGQAALAAVEASVRTRLGGAVAVSVEGIAMRLSAASGPLVAIPDPSARVGRVSRFVIAEQERGGRTRRVGEVSARIEARGPVLHAVHPLSTGQVVEASDVAVDDTELNDVPLRRLASAEAVIGGRVRRAVAQGAMVTSLDVAPVPLVRAGSRVTVHVSIDTITVTGEMIAAGSGGLGDIVRVVNPETRKAQRARIVAPAEVEMVDVH